MIHRLPSYLLTFQPRACKHAALFHGDGTTRLRPPLSLTQSCPCLLQAVLFHGEWDSWAPPPNYGGAVMVQENPFAADPNSGWDGRPPEQRPRQRPVPQQAHVLPGLHVRHMN